MITREELRSIPKLHKSIQRDLCHLDYLREKATCIPSTTTDHEKVQTSPSNQGNKYIEAAVDLSKELEQKQKQLDELKLKATLFIETIPERQHRRVLEYRYIKCYEWQEISDLLGYTERRVCQIDKEEVSLLE